MVANIRFSNPKEVKKLIKETEKLPFEVYLESENIYINAKSLLALYTLIGKELVLVAPDGADPIVFGNLIKRVKKAQ